MATLKISDLSVGDWVNHENKAYRLYAIEECGLLRGKWESDEDLAHIVKHIDYFEPIPITAEILVKNGWRIIEKEVLGEDYEYSGGERVWDNGDNMIDICEQKQGVFWHSTSNEYYHHRLYYVHQLQHLMRLYGVDKEINL